jgi:cytochrome c553
MKKIVLAMTIAGTTLLMADGAALYAKCAGCHGADGKTKALGKSNPIAGMAGEKTVEDLKGYKAGTLNQHGMGGLMKGQAANRSDEDMKAVAEYISTLGK